MLSHFNVVWRFLDKRNEAFWRVRDEHGEGAGTTCSARAAIQIHAVDSSQNIEIKLLRKINRSILRIFWLLHTKMKNVKALTPIQERVSLGSLLQPPGTSWRSANGDEPDVSTARVTLSLTVEWGNKSRLLQPNITKQKNCICAYR